MPGQAEVPGVASMAPAGRWAVPGFSRGRAEGRPGPGSEAGSNVLWNLPDGVPGAEPGSQLLPWALAGPSILPLPWAPILGPK